MKIGFLGVGHLATAFLGGLLDRGIIHPADVVLYDRSPECLAAWEDRGLHRAEDEADLVSKSDIVFLMIRPGDFETAMAAVRSGCCPADKLFVSTAAAVSIKYISEGLENAKVIRTMPNTALALGLSATAICAGPGVQPHELDFVKRLFESCGSCVILSESQMNEVIAVNGSSPAYVYYLADTMLQWAADRGFDRETAVKLIAQTFRGAAQMLMESGKKPSELRDAVCSPGGTTIEAVNEMRNSGFEAMMIRAMDACTKRAEELSR